MTCFFLFSEQQLDAMQCSELHNQQGMRRERIEEEERKKGRGRKGKGGGMKWRVRGGNGG
jgi:hypothetical protein